MRLALYLCLLGAPALTALGCGGGTEFPRAAEPADSPPPRARPAGAVARLDGGPEGMAFVPGADLLAVALRAPNRLAFVDPRSLEVVRAFPLPAPARHLGLGPAGQAVVVPDEASDTVLRISPGAGVVSITEVGKHPHDATAAAGRVFIADEHSDQVSVLRRGRVIATLGAPQQPGGIAAVGNRFVVLVAVAERVLQVYDARALEELGAVSAGVGPTHVVTAGDRAFVADTQGGRIRVFRVAEEPAEIATAPAPGAPYGIAVDPARDRLWVTLTAKNRLAEYDIDGDRPRLVATFPTVRQPNSVAVDPRSGAAFVAGDPAGRPGRIERIAAAGGGSG